MLKMMGMAVATRAFPWYLSGIASWFSSNGMQVILFPWLVTVVLHEPAARVGIAQMSLAAPSIVFMMLGGAMADRADLRQLLRFRRLFPGQQHEHQPEPECHAQQKEHCVLPSSSDTSPFAMFLAIQSSTSSRR